MYIALKSFKVKQADGSYRITKPGEPIPEAADWKGIQNYISRGWITREGMETPNPRHRVTVSKVKATMSSAVEAMKAASKPLTASPSAPQPEELPEVEAEPEVETSATDDATTDNGEHSFKSLDKLKKAALQDMAMELGIEPEQNKADIIAAILEAQA